MDAKAKAVFLDGLMLAVQSGEVHPHDAWTRAAVAIGQDEAEHCLTVGPCHAPHDMDMGLGAKVGALKIAADRAWILAEIEQGAIA